MNKYKIEEILSNIQFQVYSDMNFIEPLGLDKETWKELLDCITSLQEEKNDLLDMCSRKIDEVSNLQKDNKQLKELCDKYEEEHKTTFIEWKKDINIIDGLEKYLKKQMEYYKLDTDYYVEYKLTLDKLNELREDNK